MAGPLIVEALASHDGVIIAKLRRFQHVNMEMDYLEVVNLCKSRHNSRSVVAPILLEIGDLSNCFSSFIIHHAPRASNLRAHLCANRSFGIHVTESWIDFFSFAKHKHSTHKRRLTVHKHTFTHINAHMHTLPYEHIQETGLRVRS